MTNTLLNNLSFIVQIYSAELMFMWNLKRSKYFWWKISLSFISSILIACFFPVPLYNAAYSSFMYFCLFFTTIIFLKFCFKESIVNIIFCGIAAYTLQHLSYQIANVLITICTNNVNMILGNYASEMITAENFRWILFYEVIRYFCCYNVYWCVYLLFGKKLSNGTDLKIKNIKVLFLVAIGFFVDIILNSIVVYINPPELFLQYAVMYNLIIYVATGFCCILLLNVQFGLVEQREQEVELEVLKHLWQQKKEQFEVSQENINIINQKCHDMKHQIRNIGKQQKIEREVIDAITGAISVYDSIVKTGNDALNTILTEKSLICHANKITFNCIADGQRISFMRTTDIYVLFGNAIDNAIEAVSDVQEEERRIIDLVLYTQGDILTLNVINSYDGERNFENGLPLTTKSDKYYHGFGMKSIKAIVDKYKGDMTITAEEKTFSLSILLPIIEGN